MSARRLVLRPVISTSAALVTLILFGCSATPAPPEVAQVSGHVKYQGKPIQQGKIVMYTEAGAFGSATIDDGTYLMSRAPVGTVRVVVTGRTDRPKPEEMEKHKWADIKKFQDRVKKLKAEGKSTEDLEAEPTPEDPHSIPSKYGGDLTTPLTREVKAGGQVIDLDIEKD